MGRVDRRRKKKKMSIGVKILIILGLFVIAGVGGYWFGEVTGTQETAMEDSKAREIAAKAEKKREEIHYYKVGQVFKIDENVIGKVKSLKTYPGIKGPKYPIGLQIDLKNNSQKKVDLPYKYLFQLKLKNNKLARSVGIYDYKLMKNSNQLVADNEKLAGKESRTLLYLFNTDDKKAFDSKNAVLTIKSPYGKQTIKLKLEHQDAQESSSETETSSTEVIQQDSTSTTFEQTTQATAQTDSSSEATQQSSDDNVQNNANYASSEAQPTQQMNTSAASSMAQAPVAQNAVQQPQVQNSFPASTVPANVVQMAPGTLNQGANMVVGQ